MEYINIKGLDKPISKLIMGTAWFNPAFEEEIFTMLDQYVAAGGTVIYLCRLLFLDRKSVV